MPDLFIDPYAMAAQELEVRIQRVEDWWYELAQMVRSGDVKADPMAEALGLSRSTFYRRLAEYGDLS